MINSWGNWNNSIYIYKNGHDALLSNFRPIALLNSIYKIRATVITNRLTPTMNMLTDEGQHAYEPNKSTIDAIYAIERNLIKKQCNGQILLDLSKAIGGIGRGGIAGYSLWKKVCQPTSLNK